MSRTDPAPFPAVLIVEDDPTIGQHLQLGLQGHGYPTTWCRTGAAALIRVTEAKPRIVFSTSAFPTSTVSSVRVTSLRRDAFIAVTAMVWRLQSRG